MYKGVIAYLYNNSTVVLNKNDIKNAKDEDFKEVSLYLSDKFIKESCEELSFMEDDEDDEDDEDINW